MTPISKTRFWFVVAAISIVLNIILLNLKSCSGGQKIAGYSIDTLVYKVKGAIVLTKEIPVYQPKIIRITEPPKEVIDTLPVTDSSFCKELAIDHYSQKEYRDTVGNDSIKLDLTMYVSQNNVDSVKPKVILNIPYVQTVYQVIKTPIPKNPWKVYVGAGIGGSESGFIGGAQILVTDPNRFYYSVGAYATTFSQPVFMGGFGMKISLRKK